MTIMQHLAELRTRLVYSILAIAVGAISLLIVYEPVLDFLTAPYRELCATNASLNCDGMLYALGPIDGFSARMRIALWGGVVVALPVLLWNIWRFVVPALTKREQRYSVMFIVSSIVLFALGAYLAYWTLDKALQFLIGWSGEDVTQNYQINKYVNLVVLMMLAFGVGFLSPVLLVFLQLVEVVTPRTLITQWRYAIVIIFVVAAVITPSGDPFTLFALGLPLTVLYLIAVGIGALALWRRSKTAEAPRSIQLRARSISGAGVRRTRRRRIGARGSSDWLR
jgi:sec-independent protein translocase protein TatC